MKRSQARSKESIEFARVQRAEANEFASTVWQWLRNRRCCGQKFRREYPIPPYTADFCCVELKLDIEIDGAGHLTEEGVVHDRQRDRFLKRLGFRILRIPGYEVIREDSEAYAKIEKFVRDALNALK
jgi:very-short-patch-repair endonuclease